MVPLLDITRLMSRAGRTLTGVDRVELAYLDHFLTLERAYGLARTGLGYLLLDHDGLVRFRARLTSSDWGTVDRLSRLSKRLDPAQKAAVSSVRRDAIGRSLPRGLPKLASAATDYFNVGHSNLTPQTLSRLKGLKRHVLIHDTIPLDHPDWQRPGTPAAFRKKFDAALDHADRIIANSEATAADIRRHATGPVPDMIVAHLGVEVPTPSATPAEARPYFVTVGTIEPRKNHALLLDAWEALPAGPVKPALMICGPRGWNNEAVFARLDALTGDSVVEKPGLSDADLAALIRGSRGLLFPSQAEGYGLPPIEAAALGVPVVCGDLAIYRETLGDVPIYLDPRDPYQWIKAINELSEQRPTPRQYTPPTWASHFKTVLSVS